jgi:hypothetical protein
MDLSTFVEKALIEISLGVKEARVKARDLAAIAPHTMDGELRFESSYIDFDVSLVVTDTTSVKKNEDAKVGGEIKVFSFVRGGVDAHTASESTRENTSAQTHRVAFKVPIYFSSKLTFEESTIEKPALNKDTNLI